MRLIFMGTPEFAVPILEGLLSGGHDIAGVYTQPDRPSGRGQRPSPTPLKRKALSYGLRVFQPQSLQGEVEQLGALKPEVIVVAAFGRILPPAVLRLPSFGCLNVHPSLLPRHRGASPVAGAILAGDEETGVSIMLLDEGLDTGPILSQARLLISPEDTTGSLSEKLAQLGARLLIETLPRWLSREITPQPQQEEEATYTRPLSKEEGEIDWRLPALTLWRRVRAFDPWPGCYTRWRSRLLKVWEASPLPGKERFELEQGRVVAVEGGMAVATGEGLLQLLRLQLEGRRPLGAVEFLRGQPGIIGELLGA